MSNVHYLYPPVEKDIEPIELLVSKSPVVDAAIPAVGSGIKFHIVLLVFGLIGFSTSLFALFNSGSSADALGKIGMIRIADSLENILAVLAYPVIALFGFLCLYAAQQLYRHYKRENDPENFGRNRKSDL